MTLQERIQLMTRLGAYIQANSEAWQQVKDRAYRENAWFIPEFTDLATGQIASRFLQEAALQNWTSQYNVPNQQANPKQVGIVMAGNIPLVGFHDLLCVFMSGHHAVIKASSKDEILIRHLVDRMLEWAPNLEKSIVFADQLKGCDAYLATGSNNTSRYFDYYFGKYPNIIRKNRTSVAVLDGTESPEELSALASDIQLYFGLGCRNVTQLMVPRNYDFLPLLQALKSYAYLMDYHKYKHNFDYHLALLIMGNKYYMNNDSLILTENISPFSPVSQVHYRTYDHIADTEAWLHNNADIQCIVGHGHLPFGTAQAPSLTDYADGVDTMAFLLKI